MGEDVTRLIRLAREGDGQALEKLLAIYREYLTVLARSRLEGALRAKAGASDLAQETLLRAYEAFDRFEGQGEVELTAWLRRILARNLAMLARRYRGAVRDLGRERRIARTLDRSSIALDGLLAARGPSPSEDAQRRERSVVLADALAKLSEDHRRVVVLRDLRQMGWDEVAAEMGRTADAARMLWFRALKKLRPLVVGMSS